MFHVLGREGHGGKYMRGSGLLPPPQPSLAERALSRGQLPTARLGQNDFDRWILCEKDRRGFGCTAAVGISHRHFVARLVAAQDRRKIVRGSDAAAVDFTELVTKIEACQVEWA